MKLTSLVPVLLVGSLFAMACTSTSSPQAVPEVQPTANEPVAQPTPVEQARPSGPTPEDATRFVNEAQARLLELGIESNRASWVQANFITEDTQALSAAASEKITAAAVDLAKAATRYDKLDLPYETRRKLDLLKLALTLPAPADPEKTKEITRITSSLEAMYGSGKYCPQPDKCQDLQELSKIISTSRDPKKLLEAWRGWHSISPPMLPLYGRMVELANEGSRELGYKDTGALWRSKYDMPADDFAKDVDRLWGQVKPLYDSLHCYVRTRLNEKYGSSVVPLDRPIPAHLLGNMWAQEWGNIYELVAPKNADVGYDLTKILKAKKVDAKEMVRYGERFFTSLGFDPLPKTFWDRSLFTKPKDRDVVCHASAWDLDEVDDLRIKMCIEPTAEDFQTIHHELGHNFYQRAYNKQPYLFRGSANDGFHEALGDTVALSVTPSYLVQVGLLKKEPDASKDMGLLLREAMDKIAFLPFGLLVDQWRWKVFSGEITAANYNEGWWNLREKYQGVMAPLARTEADFDPGAKYHIPGNTPYTRYFLARIQQFTFHKALCDTAGYKGPLHRCSIYGNKAAGEKLQNMMEMGLSRPWPEALEALTGTRQLEATAIIDYFAPLKVWLDEKNAGKKCGW